MSHADFRYTSRDWLSKSSAGVILGFVIAIALSSIYGQVGPGGLFWGGAEPQFVMWMVWPIWTGIISFCFLFRSGLRAWLWLGAAALASGAGVIMAKTVFGSGI